MIRQVLQPLRNLRAYARLPVAAREQHRLDHRGLPSHDPGIERSIAEALAWLGRAQDCSATADGGFARHYSLVSGWGPSYPETTGYIIPTLLDCSAESGQPEPRERARRALDWLVSIQLPGGGFQGGTVDATPVVPVTFNTGQILMGLAAGVREFGSEYEAAMTRAADWLVQTQDADGAWRSHPTPFAAPGDKVYETHVAWGLMEAERVAPGRGYGDAALSNVRWALTRQAHNGWFADCCLVQPLQPLTHTIGYVLRGVIEAYRLSGDPEFLSAARRTADGLLAAIRPDGALPGRIDAAWKGAVPWTCLTGNVQIAHCWMMLHQYVDHEPWREAAFGATKYVRRTLSIQGPPEIRGGVKGSFPVDGGYGRYEYLNWAAKFMIDALRLERALRSAT